MSRPDRLDAARQPRIRIRWWTTLNLISAIGCAIALPTWFILTVMHNCGH